MGTQQTIEELREALEQMQLERDQARAMLSETRLMLQMVMDNLPQPIYWKDRFGRFLGCNKLFSELSDLENPDELIGLTESEIQYDGNPFKEAFAQRESDVMAHGIPQFHVIDALKRAQGHIWVDSCHVPLFRNDKIIGVLGTFEDITERIENEEELNRHRDHLTELVRMRTSELERTNANLEQSNRDLEKANVALDKASKARSQFVANISHEIRTPLNAVMVMTELVMDTDITSVQREYLNTILESADSLLFTINDILDYSKIEAGKLSMEAIRFNLRETLESTMKALSVKAFQKGLELIIDIDPSVPPVMLGDPLRVRQVFSNLVSNAIKFTEEGEIRLKVAPKQLEDKVIRLDFEVQDTGIGIPVERQRAIFNAFEQVDNSTTRNYGGSGLGLSIVSQLVDLMQGDISLESEEGKGSTFFLTLQFEAIDGSYSLRKKDPLAAFSGKHAIIIDENEHWSEVLKSMLKRWGFDVQIIDSIAGIDSLAESQSEVQDSPDLIVVDPVFSNGKDAMKNLVNLQKAWIKQPRFLFALSVGQHVNHLEKRAQFQRTDYVFKPVVDHEVASKIESLFGKQESKQAASAEVGPEAIPLDNLKVLLVDDREMNLKIGKALLGKFGCDVETALNGEDAIESVKTGQFDVVLMDIQMPVMDGYEAARRIRNWEAENQVPGVVIYAATANERKDDIRETIDAGMDDYIEKPIRVNELRSKLEDVRVIQAGRAEASVQIAEAE
jgi:two-component system sensor histidine kinase/response regulator